MNRVDRLFGILTLLQSKKYVTAEKIAEAFAISVRTVYRDIKALGEQGVPVGFEPHKGYFVVQGYFLPPVSFTSEEANALLLMEAMVFGFTDKSIHTHYASALNKVKAVLRTTQKEQLDFLHHHIKLQLPACLNNDYEYLAVIQQAISNKCILEIGYKNNKAEVSKRRVEPIGLIFYAFSWHLIGWCHHRQDYRDFRVSRILTLKNTELPFLKPDHMPVSEYMKQLPVAY
ncbi:helix-turn-helix transcriptional regulator [Rufibacter psychrotolerans]|uniref:helix-turn-helix transcriptional regulator n=1 Tax=Rufibacter psychrotolerans TaxID=2812556 RepID=UPI00196765F8|nr:YafY family protein [Rufibacter sp. SYSU D00308]